jgi:hypothetical protein
MSGYTSGSSFDRRPAPDFSFATQGGYPSYDERKGFAESMGLRVHGGQAIGTHHGKKTTTPLGQFAPPQASGWGGGGMMPQLSELLAQ